MKELNLVTAGLIAIFLLPLAAGALKPFSRERIRHSLGSLLDNIEFLAGILLSVYLTKKIFFEKDSPAFEQIYTWIPEKIKILLYGQDVLTYIVSVPVILLVLLLVLRIFTNPLYEKFFTPLADRIHDRAGHLGNGFKRCMGALWELPKSLYLPLVLALLLNFYTYYVYAPTLTQWMNESEIYQAVHQRVLNPVLNSNIAKQIPVILNDSFRNAVGKVIPAEGGDVIQKIGDRLTGGNFKVIEYFNGVTLEEAIKSSPEIEGTAKKITAGEPDDKKKAYLLYRWVSENVEYDYEKAEQIVAAPGKYASGALVAYNTRKGICFDYSALYIAMCRSVGLKVRIVVGLGYSGLTWGDHAWNQVYYPKEDRWIDLDATFGSSGINYFDKRDFSSDHKDASVQGEW